MALVSYASSIQGVAIRATRLTAAGTPVTGATGSYVMNAFIRTSFTPEYEEGERITEKTAAGAVCVDFKAPDTLQRVTLELAICSPDPEFTEILAGGTILTSSTTGQTATTLDEDSIIGATQLLLTTDPGVGTYTVGAAGPTQETVTITSVSGTVAPFTATLQAPATKVHTAADAVTPIGASAGYAAPVAGVDANPNGCSLEVWSRAVEGTRAASYLPYFHWIFPFVQLRPTGDRAIENGLMANVFSGTGDGNIGFASGPAGAGNATAWPYPSASARPYAYARVADAPLGINGYVAVV